MSQHTTSKGHAQSSSVSSIKNGVRASKTRSPRSQDAEGKSVRDGAEHQGKGRRLTASSLGRSDSRETSRDRDAADSRSRADAGTRGGSVILDSVSTADGFSDDGTTSPSRSPAPNTIRYTHAGVPRQGPVGKQNSHSAHDLLRTGQASPGDLRSSMQDFGRTTSLQSLHQESTQSTHSTPGSGGKVGNAQQEEKKGFFKRMFGASSSRSNLGPEYTQAGSPSASRNASVITTSHLQQAGRDPSPVAGTNRELSKKASFFRRKKKSMSEAIDIPQIPVQSMLSPDPTGTARSSLYRAMDEYLTTDPPRTPDRQAPPPPAGQSESTPRIDDSASNVSTEADPTLFHSGYTGSSPADASRTTSPRKERSALPDVEESPIHGGCSVADTETDHWRSASVANARVSKDDVEVTPRASSQSRLQNKSHAESGTRFLVQDIKHSHKLPVTSMYASKARAPSNGDESCTTTTDIPVRSGQTIGDASDEPSANPAALELTYQDSDAADVVPDLIDRVQPREGPLVPRNLSVASTATSLSSGTAVLDDSSLEDQERARCIFNGSEDPIPRSQAAAFLGERKPANVNTLAAFMELFNFTNQSILGGLRILCGQIILKAESQQVDRILVSFASRWCACNPNHGFLLRDVVHTMCYSFLLLNTDMHMADIESKMTRSQFVKNTLPTIKRVVAEATPSSFKPDDRPGRPELQWQDSASSAQAESLADSDTGSRSRRPSIDGRRPTLTKRMSWSLGMGRSDEEARTEIVPNGGSTALVNGRFDGKPTEWHFELEAILKSCFTAVKNEALPLNRDTVPRLRRANSIRSMAPSEMSMKSRKTGFHSVGGRWGNRGARPKMYASSQYGSSRTSVDDGSSVFSHNVASSAWSKLSLGKTMTTMSTTDSSYHLGPDQGFPHTIGFANALSQINAREDGIEDDAASINPQKFLLEDDTLELAGAPWAKEGMVKHKHHLQTTDKKAKERNWNECFAVIERGYLRLFSFNNKGGKTGSLGVRKTIQRGKASSLAPFVVGGGNWTANAEQLGSFLLRQTIASALPPPGYSKARPHVWALSLPSGAVHLFQVGTPEIATEFVKTANYWSARLSKEPLMGGIENTEYGWSDALITPSLIHPVLLASAAAATHSTAAGSSGSTSDFKPSHRQAASASNSLYVPRASISGSIRSGMDAVTQRTRLPGDKAHVEDWRPPAQSMMASQLMEVDQLQALKDYVAGVEADLSKHNELRADIPGAYSSRHPNAAKAIHNWEKKSAYLLREIVKFRTYIDALQMAQEEKLRFEADRADREREKEDREKRKAERRRLESETALAEEEGPDGEHVKIDMVNSPSGRSG